MITEQDLQEAIAECEGQRNPTANTCIKLAAFYTIKQHLFPDEKPSYSFADSLPLIKSESVKNVPDVVNYKSDSEFAQAIYGLPNDVAWSIMDELMSTIAVINPKLYNSTMRKVVE